MDYPQREIEAYSHACRYLNKAERIKGVWSHWMNAEGQPVKFGKQIESGDLVETSFMMMGLYAFTIK